MLTLPAAWVIDATALPPALLKDAVEHRSDGVTSWSIKWAHGLPEFTATLNDTEGGGTIRAGFQKVGGFWRTAAVQTPAAAKLPQPGPQRP